MDQRGARGVERGAKSRWVTWVSWVGACGLLLVSLCWLGARRSWTLDLIGNLGAQWLVAALVCSGVWLVLRRWKFAAVGLLASASLLASLGIGSRSLMVPDAGVRVAGSVRFFHSNASTRGDGASIEAQMAAADADVLSVACPPVAHQRDVIYGDGLANRYPGKLVREWRVEADGVNTDVTAGFLVSRWPLRRVDATNWEIGPATDYLIAAIVERPGLEGGEFAVLALHPRSPRSPARWALGTLVVEAAARMTARLHGEGYAVVVLADLNSTPSGARSRLLCREGGLYRAKPLLRATGTYPLPLGPHDDTQGRGRRRVEWGLGVAIDDAWVSRSVEVVGWGVLDRLESEHVPIILDARIPVRATLEGSVSGR